MNITSPLLLCAALLLPALPAWAQHGHHGHGQVAQASPAAEPAWAEGEVRRIDKTAQKITLKHGEIRNLDMMPMTMVFRVQDPALLDKAQVGDAVRFTAEEVQGALVVKALEVVGK